MPDLADYRPFRPRAARIVAWSLVALIVTGVVTLLALSFTPVLPGWTAGDSVLTVLFFGAGVWVIAMQGRVQAIPDENGLTVRNLLRTRQLAWEEIVQVSLTRGRPWVDLDLSDGSTLAVMAIQSADGAHGIAEARRLSALVAAHEAPQ